MRYVTLKLILAAMACLCVTSFAQQCPTHSSFAIMKITTQNNQEPQGTAVQGGMNEYTFKYVHITSVELKDPKDSKNNITHTTVDKDSLRGRGNSTWNVNNGNGKKPYRIKFGNKTSVFGKEAAKSWVLLANYYDQTMALNSIAFKLGHNLGLHGTPNANFVDLCLNGSYKGIYQLTDQIQVSPGRVNIDKDKGWLIELDYHQATKFPDDINFKTNDFALPANVKSPEDLPRESDYQWVKDELNAILKKMNSSGFPNNGYRDQIDLESFAKYVLIQQFMDNFDFNSKTQDGGLPGSNFVYKDVGKKMMGGPLWDFDLSAGVIVNSFPKHFNNYNDPIKPRHAFYQKLWDDHEFICKFKEVWSANQSSFTSIPAFIDSIANVLGPRAQANFTTSSVGYPTGNTGGWGFNYDPVVPKTEAEYKTEAGNLKTWWNNRMTFFGQEVNKLTCNPGSNPSSSSSAPTQSSSSGGDVPNTNAQFVCTLNAGASATVGVAIVPENIFSVRCNSIPLASASLNSPNTIWSSLTPIEVGDFTITVSRTSNASSCANHIATCTVPVPDPSIFPPSSSSNGNVSPVKFSQITAGNITAKAIVGGIMLENVPIGAKVEVYNLHGKNVYSRDVMHYVSTAELQINIPTGMYIVKAGTQILRIPVR